MADIFGEDDYLQPGFDASSMTIPRLRNALNAHDIPFNLAAKKSELVAIFNTQLQPKAKRILTQRAKIRRTSMGIESVANSQSSVDSTEEEDEVEELPEPVASTRSRRTTRSTRSSTVESHDEPTPRAAPTSRRRPTRTPAESIASSVEPESVRIPRSTRRSVVPEPTVEDVAPSQPLRRSAIPESLAHDPATPRRVVASESPFTTDNPFQSGSSPLAEDEEPRRESTARKSEGGKSTMKRRRTKEPTIKQEQEDSVTTTSRTITVPSKSLRKSVIKQEPSDTIEPGEEFTPEEAQSMQESEQTEIAKPRKKKNKTQSSALASAPLVILTTLLAAYAVWWRQEKLQVGYCGVGKPATTLQELQVPEMLDFLQPKCEPCPQHAYCYSDMEARCEQNFILKHHPLSLGGLIPLTPTCEPDGEKARKVKSVADRAVEELRERRAKFECGELTESNGKRATVVEIPEPSLKATVSSKKRRTMSDEEFEDIWKGAIGEIQGRDEVTSDAQGFLVSSTGFPEHSSSVQTPLVESAGTALSDDPSEQRWQTLYFQRQLTIRQKDKARVPGLVAMVLDRLATQAALHEQGSIPDQFMSLGQLRDDVLRDEFSNKRRDDIWKRVQVVVERNANVRASVREGRSGDVGRQWEWIGSTDSVDESRLIDRRRSGRYSILPMTPDDRSPSPIKSEGETTQPRRWDEGRPIY